MKVIARERGTGKTKELLYEAWQAHGQVLSLNKRAIQSKAEAYGFIGLPIIDWNDILYGEYDKNKPLYIDNAEGVFAILLENDFELKLAGMNVNIGD